jgi:DNA invertase Pin-like site-specific DNA recombinase
MGNTPSFFLYARKSTDVEDKQVMSIDRQLFELREFAAREGLNVVSELIEKQSAKIPGRPIFNAMMERIETGEANGILAWHPDRLSRNGVDGGRITYALDTGKLTSLKFPTFWFENTPQGKFMLNMAFSQSKYYVDALAENTKSGLREKVRRGEYPGMAPFGYLNDYRTKRIIVDRQRAPLVKNAFEQYATGNVVLDDLRKYFSANGVKTKKGKMVGRTFVSDLLSNPIHYGHFRYAGEVYEGKHEPIISKKLFDDVEAVFNRRWRYSPSENKNEPKVFLGLLRCSTCGGAITGEIQKGHTYYRCTKKSNAALRLSCKQPYIREEDLNIQISDLLKPFSLRADWADDMLTRVKEEKKQSAQSNALMASQKRAEIEKINLRLQKLLDSFLDGVIDREAYVAEKSKGMSQKKSLEEQSNALLKGRADWLEPFQSWILTARNAGKIAVEGSPQEKKVLAQKVFGSNLVLDCKKARGSCMKPWSLLLENPSSRLVERAKGIEPSSRFTILKAFRINGFVSLRTNKFELFILTFILTPWQAL